MSDNNLPRGARRELPLGCRGYGHRYTIGGCRVYLCTKEYKDGSLARIIIDTNQEENPILHALLTSVAESVSTGLQYGVPLKEYVKTYTGTKFEPSGAVTGSNSITWASSVLDLIFRELGHTYTPQLTAEPVSQPSRPPDSNIVPLFPRLRTEPKR